MTPMASSSLILYTMSRRLSPSSSPNQEKEVLNSRSAPRILSVDHFFVEDGKFDYDPELEPTYRHELFKLFKRQIDEGFFSVILLDCINERIEQFSQFYQYAKINRFQVMPSGDSVPHAHAYTHTRMAMFTMQSHPGQRSGAEGVADDLR